MAFKKHDDEQNSLKEKRIENSKIMAKQQVDSYQACVRLCHHLACENKVNKLKYTRTKALIVPQTMLISSAFAFAEEAKDKTQCFCVLFDEYIWGMMQYLRLQMAWIDENYLCLRFKEEKVANYIIPSLSLAFPVLNPKLLNFLKEKIFFVSMGCLDEHYKADGTIAYGCKSIQKHPAPLLRKLNSGGFSTRSNNVFG